MRHRPSANSFSFARKARFSNVFIMFAVLTVLVVTAPSAVAQSLVASNLDELRTYAAMDNVNVTLAAGEYWLEGDGSNPNFLDFSGSNSTFNLSGAQIKMDTRELAGYGNSQGVRPITMTGSNNLIQGLDFSGHDIDLATDPDARRYSDRSAVYLQVTGSDNRFQDTSLLVRGSSPYGYGDVFGKGARFPESGDPVEDGGFAFLSHNKTSSFLVTGGAENTVVDNLDLTSQAYGHGFFVQGGASNTTIRNSTIIGELVSGNDAIAHPEYQEYAAGADGILGTSDDGGTRSGTPLPENIFISAQEDGIRAYSGTSGLHVENTVVRNFRSGVHSTFSGGTNTIDGLEAYGTENAFIVGSGTTITNSKADIVNGPAIYVQYNNDDDTTIDLEIVGDVPEGVDWAVAYINGDNFDVTLRSDLPAGFLPEDSVVRLGQTWFNNWRDQLKPTGPETADPGPLTNSTFNNLTNELTVLGDAAVGNSGYSKAGVVTNGKENHYDGLSFVLSGTHVVLTDSAGLGNNGRDENGDFDADVFETNASVVLDGATLELQSGLRISNEKLTITGDGVDGRGAFYSDGTVGTDTRFGSASGNENGAIFLDGDASIGVGIAGQQLNIGGLNGQGDFTKRGAGLLTIGKASNLDGDMIIAEGEVSARSNVVLNNLTVAAGAGIRANGGLAYNTDGTASIDGVLDLNARSGAEDLTQRVGRLNGSGSVISSNVNAGTQDTLEIVGTSGIGNFAGSIIGDIHLEKSGSGTQILSGNLAHTGTTSVEGGALLINGSHTSGGSYTVSGGTLGGSGVIGSEVIVNAGSTLAPGSLGLDDSGVLTLSGDLSLASGSTLAADFLSDSAYDQVVVNGTASIAGHLDLNGSSNLSSYSTKKLLVSDAVNGTFDSVDGVLLDDNTALAVTYSSNDVSVTRALVGDFNLDGRVSNADISPLRFNLGQTGTWVTGDASGDGLVSNADIALLRSNLGSFNTASEAGSFALLSAISGDELVTNLKAELSADVTAQVGDGVPNFSYDAATGELTFVDDGAGVFALTFNTLAASILPLETFESESGSSWIFNSFDNDSFFEFTDESFGFFPANGGDLVLARLATGLTIDDFGLVDYQISGDAIVRSASISIVNAVPGPATGVVLAFGVLAFVSRRRRNA